MGGLDGGGNGRDRSGKFAKGNAGGPGRPSRAVERDYLAALSDRCPPDVWAEVVDRAVEDARKGDAAARAWLSKYLLGGYGTASHPMGLCGLLSRDEQMGELLRDVL